MTFNTKLVFFALMLGILTLLGTRTLSITGKKQSDSITVVLESQAKKTTVSFTVELAVTLRQKRTGLMHRKNIPDRTGMMFVYERDEKCSFWMKDTPHPLSIAFIDASGCIREIYDMQPFSLEVITGIHAVRYALEAAQGAFERAGIGVGDRLSAESVELLKKAALH